MAKAKIKAPPPLAGLTPEGAALLGAIEMLDGVAHGQSWSALEYSTRLYGYKVALLKSHPAVATDPWYGRLFAGIEALLPRPKDAARRPQDPGAKRTSEKDH